MKIHLTALVVVSLAVTLPATGQSVSCLSPGDSSDTQLLGLTRVMRAADTSTAAMRADLGLVGLDTVDMQLVADNVLCARLDSALMLSGTPQLLLAHVVYALGTRRYAVFTPGPRYTTIYFIDDRNQLLGMM
jgi:hypothetical protein